MRPVTRRRFLLGLGLAAAGVSALSWPRSRDVVQLYAESVIDLFWSPARRLQRHFAYLQVERAAVEQYITDYERHVRRLTRFKQWPDDIYTRFLLSTDFFKNGADESRPIKYALFYHPYVTLCYNPLARFV